MTGAGFVTYRTIFASFCVLAVLASCGPSSAPDAAQAPVAAPAEGDAWARATPEGARVAGGYVTLRNDTEAPRRLVAAASPRAAHVELHTMTMDGDVMRMRKVDGFDVPAKGALVLAPGGNHLMFIDIDRPFVAGETVPVTLTYADGATEELAFPVRTASASGGDSAHGGHGH
jgi:copper(I)-binding protein